MIRVDRFLLIGWLLLLVCALFLQLIKQVLFNIMQYFWFFQTTLNKNLHYALGQDLRLIIWLYLELGVL